VLTNRDVTTGQKAAADEHWYRHRTAIENVLRDGEFGAAFGSLRSHVALVTGHGPGDGVRVQARAAIDAAVADGIAPRCADSIRRHAPTVVNAAQLVRSAWRRSSGSSKARATVNSSRTA